MKAATLIVYIRFTLATASLLIGALPALAQQPAFKTDDFLIEAFELPDGPSGNSVNCIVQGPNGFLWFGSHTGLYRYDGYRFKSYRSNPSDSTSLAFSYIEWLYWSSDNYLWIGTYGGGLFRFNPDDESFLHYRHDPDDPASLSNDRVTVILEESKDVLWVGTTDGLNRLDRTTGTFERFLSDSNDPGSLSFNDVRALYIDRQGTLWVGTGFFYQGDLSQGGLNRFDPKTKTFTRYLHHSDDPKSLLGNIIKAIHEDSQGNFWVGSTGGLQKMDRKTGTFQRMLDDPKVDGDIFAPGIGKEKFSIVYSLLEDQAHNLWIFSLHDDEGGSIAKVDAPTGRMEIIWERADIIPWQSIQCADGSIWLAGAGVGARVHKIRQSNAPVKYLPFITTTGGVSRGISFEGLVAQGDTLLWGKTSAIDGTPQILGIRKTSQNWNSWGIRDLPEVKVKDPNSDPLFMLKADGVGLVLDQYGDLWGCTGVYRGGLFEVHPSAAVLRQHLHDPGNPNSPADDDIRYVMSDRKGNIWMAGFSGVSRLDPVSLNYTHYLPDPNDPTSLSDATLFTLFEDRDGDIWAGGIIPDGPPSLERLDPLTGKVKRVAFSLSDQNSRVTAIAQNKAGDIFCLLANKKLVVFTQEQQSREVWDENLTGEDFLAPSFQDANNLIADNQGILWLTKNDGIILRLDTEIPSITTFQGRQGLKFTGRRAFKLADGTIYFAYQEGLVAIAPLYQTSDQFNGPSLQVRFTEFFLNGQRTAQGKQNILDRPVWETSKINLSYQQGNFGLRFSAFDFKTPENCQYEVRLLPAETEWHRIEGEPLVNYYQLPPGKYTLEVKGSDSNGMWAREIASIDIHIAPPWWKSWWAFAAYGLFALAGIFLFDRDQRRRIIQKERQRTLERELAQSREIEKAYANLKATQAQLIQSEKLASLGELTAGIAHEIQNPINFVNNFSELSIDLAEELKTEMGKLAIPEKDKDYFGELLTDLTQNQQKIHHHGKRAANIVTGMLQHARSGTGAKAPTDLNALADEYLRLTYHGLRAKDPTFSASMETDFDPAVGKVEVVAQDIGRVFLNIINNAFYATQQRKNQEPEGYTPTVTISSEKTGSGIVFRIRDNGTGIPEEVREKIFQPFFTTKPTGQGTGLGLSLAYDIIVKGHGGTLDVESEEGTGTTFITRLPAKQPFI